jgi:hypothetical protein
MNSTKAGVVDNFLLLEPTVNNVPDATAFQQLTTVLKSALKQSRDFNKGFSYKSIKCHHDMQLHLQPLPYFACNSTDGSSSTMFGTPQAQHLLRLLL